MHLFISLIVPCLVAALQSEQQNQDKVTDQQVPFVVQDGGHGLKQLEEKGNNYKKNVLDKFLKQLEIRSVVKVPEAGGCLKILENGINKSGIYNVDGFKSYCDMETDGGGWLVFQRRGHFGSPATNFDTTWDDYKNGFGNMNEDFWMGNDRLSAVTLARPQQLRVDFMDGRGTRHYAQYNTFRVQNEADLYRLTVGDFTGNAGDGLHYHNNSQFFTKDRPDRNNCARNLGGGWWFHKCYSVHLNKDSLRVKPFGLEWLHYYDLVSIEMKTRQVSR